MEQLLKSSWSNHFKIIKFRNMIQGEYMQLKNYIKNWNTGSKNIKDFLQSNFSIFLSKYIYIKSKNNDGTTIEIELVESFQNNKIW